MRIDAHQHFWCYEPEEYAWIGESDSVLKRDFLPADLAPLTTRNEIHGTVAVQARQSLEETQWLLSLAEQSQLIRGVVGWVDLRNPDLELELKKWNGNSLLKGFRHVLQDEPDPDFMLQQDFIGGLNTLQKLDYSYDLLIFAKQLPQAKRLLQKVPELRVVVDHIAKPDIASGDDFAEWQIGLQEMASFPNTYCKLSGMVTEADAQHWRQIDFYPYIQAVLSAFGPERVMFGSDWPVCLLAAEYHSVVQIVESYIDRYYPGYNSHIFGGNAKTFYQL